ncbi:cilia- and flagella-associated protein 95-like isoform X1 [Hoplias malabaricus]|uniref:cilia- and flagella-associated protein 95-like isoform X1 n=1 Tax=Hoplias malabaricus TaxID=27720 RepID=UPI0034633B8E
MAHCSLPRLRTLHSMLHYRHKHREAEPKDYDITACTDGQKKLHKSTYKYFGTCIDADWSTTAETQMSQYVLKKDYETKETPKSMVHAGLIQTLVFDRDAEITGCQSILPRHPPGHNEMELCTTYALDYLPLRFTIKDTMPVKTVQDQMVDFRRRQSHFTDVADHRRWGRNAWQDVHELQPGVRGVMKPLYSDVISG